MSFLVSTKISMVLLLLLSVAMAVATFIENDFGTLIARNSVYEAWWFEAIMVWLCINFIAHIKQYNLLSKGKLAIGLFHLAFVVIIIGAGITRYISKEGIVHIREGEKVSDFITNDKYLQFKVDTTLYDKKVQLIPYHFKKDFLEVEDKGSTFKCEVEAYIPNAKLSFEKGEQTLLHFDASTENNEPILVDLGTTSQVNDISFSFLKEQDTTQIKSFFEDIAYENVDIFVAKINGNWSLFSKNILHLLRMHSNQMATIPAKSFTPVVIGEVYKYNDTSFVINGIYEQVMPTYVATPSTEKNTTKNDKVKLKVYKDNQTITQMYVNAESQDLQWHSFIHNGQNYAFAYGSKRLPLPFSLHLDKFELKRYPGSESPESYKSYIKVSDTETSFPFEIYMNNVLDYKGYRFYQSSYDSDYKGTLLAVNKDRIGTWVTYFGYGLLFLAMIFSVFSYRSRFQYLSRRLKKFSAIVVILLSLQMPSVCANERNIAKSSQNETPSKTILPNVEQADAYGQLIVQGIDGRMKPLRTLAYEIVRKLVGKTKVTLLGETLTPEQFLLVVQMAPEVVSQEPIIRIEKDKSALVLSHLGIKDIKNLRFIDFLDANGSYKLKQIVDEVNQIKPSLRSEFEKELLKVDERFNILYALFSGNFLRLFPNKNSEDNKWHSSKEFDVFDPEDASFVKDIHSLYLSELQKASITNDYTKVQEALGYIHIFQKEAGKRVYPSDSVIKAELFYTKAKIGTHLFGFCILLGALLLIVTILQLFSEHRILKIAYTIGRIGSIILFLVFTFDLLLRWYIAKHPPWSDGFEMLLFVSWAVLLFGVLFSKKSAFTLPLGVLFSGVLLLVSFLDWLNPEITTLKPVLNSYWLKIHVAVIVGSYAPLALSCITALLSLLLLIFKPIKRSSKWFKSMQELIIVQEMSITIGLYLLSIGTFLGGIWANESWGRYWAWDPKETWALISILIYAIVAHLRLIPSFKNAWIYHIASLWAFASIIMTSYGVNYYLVGLHSYATGDPVPIPMWVYVLILLLSIISIYSYISYRDLPKQERDKWF